MNKISTYFLLAFFVAITLPLSAGKHERDTNEEGASKKQKIETSDVREALFTEDELAAARKELIKHPFVLHDEIDFGEDTDRIRLLLEVATQEDMARLDDYGLTLVHSAALAGDRAEEKLNLILHRAAVLGLYHELLAARDSRGRTPLMVALREGMGDVAQLLIQAGSDLLARDNNGKTILHFAALGGLDNLIIPLIQQGVSPEVPDTKGCVPLHYACKDEHSNVIKELLQRVGVHGDIQDHQNNTPLHYAARLVDPTAVQLLIRARVHIDAVDNQGKTPLIVAIQSGAFKTAQVLVDAGACVESTFRAMTPLHMVVALWSQEGDVPLNPRSLELKHHKLCLLRSLLAQGAHILQRDDLRATPLQYAITSHHHELVKALLFESYLPCNEAEINSSYTVASWLRQLSWKSQRISAVSLMKRNAAKYSDFLNRHIERHFLALKQCVGLVKNIARQEKESEEIYQMILQPIENAQKFSELPVEFQERIRENIFKRFSPRQ